MARNLNASAGDRTTPRVLQGKLGPVSIVAAVHAATLVAVLALFYLIIFFAAVQVVPLTMGFVKSGTGVTLDMPMETVISVWIVPALFLVALLFVLVLLTMRAIWRLRVGVITRVSRWAFGEDDGRPTPLPAGPTPARNRKTSSSKAA
jgi:hypothetical protein